ncbi:MULTISPECIES: DegT/DnrJ/EryC1/StrS family aminotransferase [unclassified Halomonas]|uniref:DegT/DnrJ/EryC1/StrS family aminotransferase n=1 Tax=unclassified Halomonas TaxID=2609666 RepID=UPI001CF20FA7|nr:MULTISPECIES: DegT/DnrJ/EryC1/StrS family aminotransferase [unclassified Halomonas]MCA8866731.1 DegT/DnrJ/EryC1/StrS family aminotransferase [Halomonas sp. SBBP1]UZH09238.1 DegT/DnrJ/EryC1/StrS family aminotransferase [Halomonas sp. BDJS001]
MSDKPIYVTEPYLPPLEEFIPYLEKIWKSKRLTNNGPMHQQLEEALCEYLGVPEIALFNNGTIALLTALQALRITGEVITTPFSFVATAHSLTWNGITPVFVDIDPNTFNLDPKKIEAAITSRTTAIMPVHCYGNPCDVNAIQEIADKYNLKVIYDAAHAFGVQDEGGSILRHGDLSAISFHATKVFNTFEGGAIICPDKKTKQHINNLKNFGFVDEVTVVAPGINGKMSEVNSAFGLLQLKYIDAALESRKLVDKHYRDALSEIKGIRLLKPLDLEKHNFSYFPIVIDKEYPISRDKLYFLLREKNIYARRYFYPLISNTTHYNSRFKENHLKNAKSISEKVICLPIFPEIEKIALSEISSVISNPIKR